MIISWCTRRVRRIFRRTRSKINARIERGLLTVRSLTFNSHINKDYVIDFLLGPMFWIVDNFAGYLGKFFVFAVVVLTSAVVLIAYWLGLPYWWERNENMTFFLVGFGNWILINIVFNYYKGVTTSPGFPPEGKNIPQVSSICRKCLKLKPPRTHHCSVCDRCILGMDHHCPWLNNCVGYFNARYFFLYMIYLLIGVLFLMVAGLDLGYVAIYLNDTGILIKHDDPDLIGHPVRRNKSGVLIPGSDLEYDINIFPRFHDLPVPLVTEAQRIAANPLKKKALIFVAVSCICVLISMTTLVIIHGKQISRGETSIEAHTNANLRKKSRRFRNPYNFGFIENWRTFLGLKSGRTFMRHILFPSSHSPEGTGLTWRIVRSPLNGRQFI